MKFDQDVAALRDRRPSDYACQQCLSETLIGDEEPCDNCGRTVCIPCYETTHLPLGGECRSVDPSEAIEVTIKGIDTLEKWVASIDTVLWALRNQRDLLMAERGNCRDSGHLWDGGSCVLCNAEEGE